MLHGVTHQCFEGQIPLARQVIAALSGRHDAPAQALAVSVIETVVLRELHSTNQQTLKKNWSFDFGVSVFKARLVGALAPLLPFYTGWTPGNSPYPPPKALSRHVSAHQADEEHYTEGNAIIAMMLMVSVPRALQERREWPRNMQERSSRK